MTVHILGAIVKSAVIAALMFAALFFFRLGFFIPFVVLIGAGLTFVFTWHSGRAAVGLAGMASYAVCFLTIWAIFVHQQEQQRRYAMSWSDTGVQDTDGRPEIRLEFLEFPGNYITVHGARLRDRLLPRGDRPVDVDFTVTSEVGCVRGIRPTHIDGKDQGDMWVFGGMGHVGAGNSPPKSPWASTHWWCQ